MITDAIKKLKPFLTSSNKELAKKAAEAISRLQAKLFFAKMYHDYDSLNEETKTKLLVELKNISSAYCIDFILKSLVDQSPYVRALAVKAAAELREPKLIEKIFPLTKDEDPVVRKLSYQFMALFPLPKISEVLNNLINKESDTEALVTLIETLGEIGSSSSLETLEKMLESLPPERVVIAIVEAIGKLKI